MNNAFDVYVVRLVGDGLSSFKLSGLTCLVFIDKYVYLT